jgi:hypothetical protein
MLEELIKGYFEKHAANVAVLAFRCAWQIPEKRDEACAAALETCLDIHPGDPNASGVVAAAIIEAVQRHPHWLETKR